MADLRVDVKSVADSEVEARAGRDPSKSRSIEEYWTKRKDAVYLAAAKQICAACGPDIMSVIDVGSNRTPTLEWHRRPGVRLVSLDRTMPYVADGVESLRSDFLQFQGDEFDLATCFQVLEHVPDAGAFARKLLAVAKVVVVSVPYAWPAGKNKYHVHDPVDATKMLGWFGCKPAYAYVAIEPVSEVRRLIHVYGAPGGRFKGIKGARVIKPRPPEPRPLATRARNWLRKICR